MPLSDPSLESILIADDDAAFCATLHETLKLAGYESGCARDGAEALERLSLKSYDVLLTDILMPGRDGIELIVACRQSNPDIRVIAMSGGGRMAPEFYLSMARALRVNVALRKPFSRDELFAAIADVMPRRPIPTCSAAGERRLP